MNEPIILATWTFGQVGTRAGWPVLIDENRSRLDAVEAACIACEDDENIMYVGRGSYPDRLGDVTLDASIMLSPRECGAVCYVRRHVHVTTLARLVMEKTPHILLAGDGADRFGVMHGMKALDHLHTDASRAAYEKWIAEHPEAVTDNAKSYLPSANVEESEMPTHDTVGVLANDSQGRIAGACSTSGWSYKVPGRVGDSPIIGHALYVDPECGAAVTTGTGELVMRTCGSFVAVEAMRRGATPAEAAMEVIARINRSCDIQAQHQVGIITLAPGGEWSQASLRPGFKIAVKNAQRDEVVDATQTLLDEPPAEEN